MRAFPDVAAPLDLAQIPFILASPKVATSPLPVSNGQKLAADEVAEADTDERDAEALERLPVLPAAAWQTRYDVIERFGRTLTVRIEGHSRLGMPRGRDLDVLLGVLTLYAEDYQRVLAGAPSRIVDGALADVSVNEILTAMGVSTEDRNGSASRRVRQALRRFGHLKFTSTGRVFRDMAGDAAALLGGAPGAQPRVPDRGVKPRAPGTGRADGVIAVEEEVTHLLEYAWRLSYERSPAGELRIVRLKLNDRFHQHLVTGWVAWIEAERYRALSSALARRLYVFLAGEAATGRAAPWTFDLRVVRTACGMSSERFANEIKKDLTRAALELTSVDVLGAPLHAASPSRGEWTLTFEPGPALALAVLLRGTSVLDLTGDRAQLAFLRYFGFDDAAARDLIAGAPSAVYDALCYALYVRETDPGRVTRSWRGFILERVTAKRPNTGDVGYAAWAAKRLAPVEPRPTAGDPGSGPSTATAGGSRVRDVDSPEGSSPGDVASNIYEGLPRDPAAVVLWIAVRDALPSALTDDVLSRQLIEHLVPVDAGDRTFTLGTDLLFSRSTVTRVREGITDIARHLTAERRSDDGGPIHHVRIQQVWVARAGAAPTLRSMPGGTVEQPEPADSLLPS
ncbi:MAG TPA: hypothetical protein VGD56_09920 [Gemmatirosa sp.]